MTTRPFSTLHGTIVGMDTAGQRGVIHGENGKHYVFERGALARWSEFDKLRLGARVSFTDAGRNAVDVERFA